MQKLIILLATLMLAATLLACGAKTYTVTTNSGKTYTAVGYPEYDMVNETITFTDQSGESITLNNSDVVITEMQ